MSPRRQARKSSHSLQNEFLLLDKAQALRDVSAGVNAARMSQRVANFPHCTPYSPEEIEHCHGWISSVMVRHIARAEETGEKAVSK